MKEGDEMLTLQDQITMGVAIEILVRILLACLIGGIIGYEREKKSHPAGLRTHLIVCLTSCLIILLSSFWHYHVDFLDTSRLAQGAITGIGFLGAGTILRDGDKVRGLTTAASVWMVACLGLLVGGGLYYIAIVTTFVVIFVLIVLGRLERKFITYIHKLQISLEVDNSKEIIKKLFEVGKYYNVKIETLEVNNKKNILNFQVIINKYEDKNQFLQELALIEDIKTFKVVKKL